MDDNVVIGLLSVRSYEYCDSDITNPQFTFFSTQGVVRLRISNVRFVTLSYSITTSVTGKSTVFVSNNNNSNNNNNY